MARAVTVVAASAVATLTVVGCGDQPGAQTGTGGADADVAYQCQGDEIPLEALEQGPPATELSDDGRQALDGVEVPPIEELEAWRIVEEGDESVLLVRELDEPEDRGEGRVDTHERLSIERFGPPDEDGEPGWHLRSFGRCDLQRDLGGLADAGLSLDPDAGPPGPDATELDLHVHERACASGQPADDRVELVDVERTDDELRLVIGVEPLSGDQTCPGNPPTPFTVELDEPLGERTVTDASVYPPRELDGEPDEPGALESDARP